MGREADSFARQLLDWFADNGRHDLPWQRDSDPYRIWISEIMLQQTQVATVIPYFERFVARFPDVDALASGDVDDVLSLWSGLGYYARARNLHRAAQVVVDEHGGRMPQTHETLTALPGIGRSTAAAILALSRDERHAILDGNVKRVLARFHAIHGWSGTTAVGRALWTKAEEHTPRSRVAQYTQAIMDLGATVCTRANPGCERCPVANGCEAFRQGLQTELPTPRPKRVRPRRSVTAVLALTGDGEILLERRPPTGIWGGLLSLPELADGLSAADWCREHLGTAPVIEQALAKIEHGFTHFDLDIHPVRIELAVRPGVVMDRSRWLWYNSARPPPGGLPAPIAKLIRQLESTDRRQIA